MVALRKASGLPGRRSCLLRRLSAALDMSQIAEGTILAAEV
ncbi:hypothetical protein RAB80_011599 [Fusarium oxysporum f. sp. vasinfectum]|nr:hypothetical protein RAB80_011599 [Fusarium oxysporum f. sp. vasinfectum]